MAGHSHWKQIKEHKGAADVKKGALFSKLLKAISAAAKNGIDPDFNPRLRAAILKAREANVPQENIERAIKKAKDSDALTEIMMEAYGPGGTAIIMKGVTDNTNRTTQEIKSILRDFEGKLAEPGSVKWAFDFVQNETGSHWQAKFKQQLTEDDKNKLRALIETLEEQDDIEKVYTNTDL
jgi:YebC/PmpR family DNA-binding regulatory protein